jgi:hypothetical protein
MLPRKNAREQTLIEPRRRPFKITTTEKCLAFYVPFGVTLVLAWWTLIVGGDLEAALFVVPVLVGMASVVTTVILVPFFRYGFFKPLDTQRLVFVAVGFFVLIFLLAYVDKARRAL